ncbi:DUF1775 domain-containing protein [Robertmurraya yapensis]|uniref:DUF1775 domain-containing protein n=2 Tax=Bacillaceae TaxID=186817 RepID=A0A431WK37_9BACI|nr:YcnI family protein [Bacillus yapensis]RTR35765.1 DUF1775 domain-containing protein [Bacillus yapensis]TKS98567.1 DUF1775 domain-containing protein [Bacillus yapensis]
MKKWVRLSVLFLMAFSLFAGVASAHVTVQPKETSQGTYEVFTVRVPSESEDSSTTKVEVRFPEEVNISRFEPKPGWTYELQMDESGKITSVTWTADGEGLSPTEFIQFNLQGKVADDATEIVWKAYQTYADGSVVEWVGAEGADAPASVTTVKPADPSASHEHGAGVQEEVSEDEETTSSNVPLYLAIAALVVALLSLVLALRKRG